MPKFSLLPFDVSKAPKISIESEFNSTDESIYISYKLLGALSTVDFGTSTPKHERVMKLWEKTCFELFIKNANDTYIEFNFSPDFEWNCFLFEKVKGLPVEYKKMESVNFDILFANDIVHVIIELQKKMFPENFFEGPLSAGITSIIIDKKGDISYWALSHEDIKPNFHLFESFKYKF
jgi:hypothetical protein